MSDDISLDTIENRIAKLERKIYDGTENDPQLKCLDSLINVQNRLQSLVTGREKVTSLFSKLEELEKYLTPEFAENLSLSETSKVNLILLEEDRIRNVVDALQTIKDLQQYMDSEHIRATPSLNSKFQQLCLLHSELEEKVGDISDETRALIRNYDNIVTSVSKEFILWDSILTKLETEKLASKQPGDRDI